MQPCVGFSQAFAQLQCKYTENRLYNGRTYSWEMFQNFFDDIECALICINEKKQVVVRSPVVIDGTPCKAGTKNVCVQGKCMEVGCDWVINSHSKEDACGVCHGNGTECRIVQGFYTEANLCSGLNPFLKLPTGTSMIYVREVNPTNCIIIITSSVNSTFYLNNLRGAETLPGLVNIAGTIGVYETRSNMERLYVKGHIRGPVTFNLKCADGKTRGIRYQYALPAYDKYYLPKYSWEYIYWEPCELPCGGGAQRSPAVCVEERSGEVEDKYCASINKPNDIVRACNQFPCTARWWVGPWSDCDCIDGEGIQTRLVLCVREHGYDPPKSRVVKEKECCRQPKPRIERPCNPEVDIAIAETSTEKKGRERRQMEMLFPFDENEDYQTTESIVQIVTDHSVSNSPRAAHDRNIDYEYLNKYRKPILSGNNYKRLRQDMFLNDEDNDAAMNKDFGKEQENLEKRRKKIIHGIRGRLKPHSPELNLDELLLNPLIQHRPMHRPRLLNAMMDVTNQMGRGIPGLDKTGSEKGIGIISQAGVRHPQVLSKLSNKIVHPTVRIQQQEQELQQQHLHPLTNNTLLVLRPITGVTAHKPVKEETTRRHASEEDALAHTKAPKSGSTVCTDLTTKVNGRSTTIRVNETSSCCPLKAIPTRTTSRSTTCNPLRATAYEPADLPGWLESANASSYKLILTPIEPHVHGFPETDAEFQVFGRYGSWPAGDEGNQITLFGEQVMEALLEAKRRATKPPVVIPDFNE